MSTLTLTDLARLHEIAQSLAVAADSLKSPWLYELGQELVELAEAKSAPAGLPKNEVSGEMTLQVGAEEAMSLAADLMGGVLEAGTITVDAKGPRKIDLLLRDLTAYNVQTYVNYDKSHGEFSVPRAKFSIGFQFHALAEKKD